MPRSYKHIQQYEKEILELKAKGLAWLRVQDDGTFQGPIAKFIPDDAREKVDDMCQKLLCNPIIHNYIIKVIKMDMTCGCGCE